MSRNPQSRHAVAAPDDHRAALIAGFLGWTLDAFDFFLVGLSLTAIAAEFHKDDKAIALSITVTLAFRPVGAFIFGLLADRYGRRLPLILDLIFYSFVEVLSGLAPNYATFMVLRALFGIGMGGEWGVGASLAMEKVPPKLRGVLSGLLQEGYAAGYLLAAACYFFVFPRWGWRPMFFIGGLPALLAIFVRLRVKESEVWERTRHENWSQLGRGIASHWRLFIYLVLLMMMMNFVSHGTQDLYPTLLKRAWNFSPRKVAAVTAFTMVGAISGGILFGLLSDRFGRRRSMIIALFCAILVIPLWALSPALSLLLAGGFVMQFMVQGAWGIIPAHLTELSPDSVRGFLPGFSYQCGVA
ncbi:MAG TPA: MFS transporter, partial [Pyrinomonadaceae bacterium]|nr:MFS transporter [Pyrinomonadaceae bacterium]